MIHVSREWVTFDRIACTGPHGRCAARLYDREILNDTLVLATAKWYGIVEFNVPFDTL